MVQFFFLSWVGLFKLCSSLQYPDYVDAYLRLAALAKARNNFQLSIELVVIIPLTPFVLILSLYLSHTHTRMRILFQH